MSLSWASAAAAEAAAVAEAVVVEPAAAIWKAAVVLQRTTADRLEMVVVVLREGFAARPEELIRWESILRFRRQPADFQMASPTADQAAVAEVAVS